MLLTLVPSIVYQYTLPREASGDKNKKLQLFSILISIVLTIVVILFTPTASSFLFPKFLDAIDVIQIMSIAIVPISISMIFNSRFLSIEKSKYVVIGSTLFLSIQISMILLLGDKYGVMGIASAVVFAAITEAVFLALAYKFKMPLQSN